MPLIVPAGGTFSIGSNVQANDSSNMNMSLDDVIANRRKATVRESRRGGRTRVSTSDRTIAGGRAKRAAAVNARRNITTTKKPTKMEIDKEVKTQSARTQRAKANQDKRKAGGRVAATGGRTRRAAAREAGNVRARGGRGAAKKPVAQTKTKQAAVKLVQGKPPSKKAVNAAVQAFKANGFQIPQGTQMVIRFEGPATNAPQGNQNARNAARAAGRAAANNNNNNNNNRNNNNRNSNNNRNTRSNDNNNRNNNNNNNNRRGGRGGGRGRN